MPEFGILNAGIWRLWNWAIAQMLEVEHAAVWQSSEELFGADNFSIVVPSLGESGSWLNYWQWGESNMVKSHAKSISSHKVDGLSSHFKATLLTLV